jgi:nitronate monooxygenase
MGTFRELFGVERPIAQAPMAGSQGNALAIAVARAGALGALPCGALAPDAVRAEIAAIRAATDGPFVVNFFCHATAAPDAARERGWREALSPYYAELGVESAPPGMQRKPFDDAMAAAVEETRPPIVSFHFGLPSDALLARVRKTGAKIVSSATTVDEARWLEAKGVDAIIAQGAEAGGHRGMFLSREITTQVGTMSLVPQIVNAVRAPVIAAGGIADAAGVAAVMRLGAIAAQLGTTFLLCPEATTSAVHRAALADARHTAITNVFTGRPARGIVNRAIRELGPMSALAPEYPLAADALAPLRSACERAGRSDFSPLWCGQNASGCRAVPAAEIVGALTP